MGSKEGFLLATPTPYSTVLSPLVAGFDVLGIFASGPCSPMGAEAAQWTGFLFGGGGRASPPSALLGNIADLENRGRTDRQTDRPALSCPVLYATTLS
jgi:hypothetical protein